MAKKVKKKVARAKSKPAPRVEKKTAKASVKSSKSAKPAKRKTSTPPPKPRATKVVAPSRPNNTAPSRANNVVTPPPAPVVEPPAPNRAPRRAIIGTHGVEVQPPAAAPRENAEQTGASAEAPDQAAALAPAAPEASEPQRVNKPLARVPEFKMAWTALPATVPAHLKFLLSRAEKECEAVASWPFPLGKFISSLPKDVCGLGLALLILNFEHSEDVICELCQLDYELVSGTMLGARTAIEERFLATCPEIYRKWTAQLGGTGKDIESLVAHYLIPKIDHDFQIMIAQVVLKILGAWHPVLEGKVARDRWSLDPKLIH